MALSFGVTRLMGTPIPAPEIAFLPSLALFIAFFIGALGEELGWSGYVIDPMQRRWGALRASIVLGGVWAVYHFVALMQVHRSADWIVGWSVGTVAARVMTVWLYNNTGKSVFATVLFHTTLNLGWQLYPAHGSFFNPGVTGSIMAVVAAIVVAVWGPQTLVR